MVVVDGDHASDVVESCMDASRLCNSIVIESLRRIGESVPDGGDSMRAGRKKNGKEKAGTQSKHAL